MSWIKTINYTDAGTGLKKVYNRVKGPDNNIDNILKVHSLRPHSLTGHMTLYKNVIHNTNNVLPKWYLESIGVYVSFLNDCNYCVTHHFEGLKRILKNDLKANSYLEAVKKDTLSEFFDSKNYKGMLYAKKLSLELSQMTENDVITLRTSGFSDGEILEINQVTSYFNYANRTVLGLGVDLKGDILGLSPNDSSNPEQWNHQ